MRYLSANLCKICNPCYFIIVAVWLLGWAGLCAAGAV